MKKKQKLKLRQEKTAAEYNIEAEKTRKNIGICGKQVPMFLCGNLIGYTLIFILVHPEMQFGT
ncbi:hypothetical protein H6A13_10765 [Mordavella massiliensis]|jgi:hypothetical protein|uniref:Uncharacterized protein n=1 Tax=Mordavella massiliensis TaxID=1871024 RepID=A0A938X3C7_9CLOT|nr:hypothetical protein [Mordavella massiliensis]